MTDGSVLLDKIRHGLIVSCQAYPGEPMRNPVVMTAVAQAALQGGAVGIRAQGLDDIRMIRDHTSAPLIGLLKTGDDDVFITPTVVAAHEVARAGADIVAVDGTLRPRPDGRPVRDSIEVIHAAGKLVMADCSCLDDAVASVAAGADCVGTTLAGYTPARPATTGPDIDLLEQLVAHIRIPVIAEGRIRNPSDVRRCVQAGAHAVVVGTAITHPTRITRTFVAELNESLS